MNVLYEKCEQIQKIFFRYAFIPKLAPLTFQLFYARTQNYHA